jgi:PAS domain S-box-containing protein
MSDDKYTQRLEALFSNTERVPPDPNPPATPPGAPDAEAMPPRAAEPEAVAADAPPAPPDEPHHSADQAQRAAAEPADAHPGQLPTISSTPSGSAHEGVVAVNISKPEAEAADQAAGRDRPGLLRIGRWSVRVKLAVMVLLGMLGMAVALGWLMFSTADTLFAEQAETTLRRQNEIVADQIADLTDKASGELLLARQNPEFNRYFLAPDEATRQAALADIQSLMLYLQDRFAIDEICWIRDNGAEIARCAQGGLARLDELSLDESGGPFFQPTMALNDGEVYLSPTPYVSPDSHRWVVAFATPLVLPDGRKAGIFHFEIPLGWFAAKVESNALRGGHSFLMTKDGQLLVHPQLDQFRQAAGIDASNPDQADFPLAAASGSQDFRRLIEQMKAETLGRGTYEDEQDTYEVVYQPVFGGQWIAATVLPHSVIYRSTSDLLRRTVTIAAPLLALALGLMLWYSGALVRPLHTTSRALRALAAADANLKQRVPVASRDEFGELALAFNQMVERLQDSQQRVEERTRDLALAAEVGQRLTAMRDLDTLLAEAAEIIRARFDLYYTQIYLTNPAGTVLVLHAGTGAVGRELLRRNHRLPIGPDSINGAAAAERRPVLVSDTAASGVFRPNPLLPDTRSEVSVPLLVGDRVVGALDLQSVQPGAFTDDNLPAFQALAGQLAIAIENANLFADVQEAHAEVETQARRLTRDAWRDFLNGVDRRELLGYTYDQAGLAPPAGPFSPNGEQALSAPILVTGEPVGALHLEAEASRRWAETEIELVQTVAQQVAQQIENLRLLAEAERARAEAEQASRRLTREGWQGYLGQASARPQGYVYDHEQVVPLEADGCAAPAALAQPLAVRGEAVGALEVVHLPEGQREEAAELIAVISERLGEHIENLRLFEQTQAALAQSEQQAAELRALFAAMPDVVLVYDEDGRYVRIAPTNPSLLYRPPEEMLGKTLAEVLPAPQAAAFLGHIRRVISTRELLNIEYALPIGGQEIWFSATVTPLTANTVFWIARDITERKRAEEILRRQHEYLAALQETTLGLIGRLELNDLLETIVTRAAALVGTSHGYIFLLEPDGSEMRMQVGLGVYQQFIGYRLKPGEAVVGAVWQTGEPLVVDDYYAWASRLNLTALDPVRAVVGVPLKSGAQTVGVIGLTYAEEGRRFGEDEIAVLNRFAQLASVALDNARLYAEAQQEQEKFRAVTDTATEGIVSADSLGRIIYFNREAEQIFGYAASEVIGQQISVLMPERYRAHHERGMQRYLSTREAHIIGKTVELEGRRKDGTEFPIELSLATWETREGIFFTGIIRDTTERKRAQATLAKRANELETVAKVSTAASNVLEASLLLQNVVDLTKENFGLYHAHIYLLDEPSGMLRLTAGAGEVGRRMVSEGRVIPLNRMQSLVARAAREREAVIVNDVRAAPDFLPHPLLPETRSEMAVPVMVGEHVLGVFDVQHDQPDHFTDEDVVIQTTLAAQVAVALQNANLYAEQAATVTRLREVDHLKSAFLANMSHELRTPLNSILGFTDVILEGLDGPVTDRMDNDLQIVKKNGQHLLRLINDVLDMAKIEAGKMSLSLERFDLQEVLEEVLEITGSLAREKALTLRIEPGPDERVELLADRVRLRQVMINLIGNAIKFTEQGGITLQAARHDGKVHIAVRDTGLGIPPNKLDLIFEAFSQVDTSTTRKAGGTGLGLPISRRLIELHGGHLWAESTGVPGEGSAFFIELPLERIAEAV